MCVCVYASSTVSLSCARESMGLYGRIANTGSVRAPTLADRLNCAKVMRDQCICSSLVAQVRRSSGKSVP
jgi:hypothetical protein